MSPDGQLIAVGLSEEGIGLWDAGDLTETGAPLLETGGEVMALTFSPDGKTLAAVARNGMATVWDVRSRSLRQGPFAVDPGLVIDLSMSADGTMLATAGADGVKLWDVATGAALGRIGDDSPAGHVAFSPTEPLIAFVRSSWSPLEGRNAEIWDVARRSRITTLQLDAIDQDAGDEGDVLGDVLGWAVAFSPDGRMLATADIDPLVHLWDVRTDNPIRVLDQNVRGPVLTLEFSPDGTILAVAGGNSFASLWDVAMGAQTGPWSGFTVSSHGSTIDLSSDGRRLLMTQGGKGAVWDIDPESWARRACALANRTLTRTEWEEFLPGRPYEPACST